MLSHQTMSTTMPSCQTVLKTSLALIDQFHQSLNTTSSSIQVSNGPSPLLLYKASAESIKSTTTKLSLLAINAPFTSTAVTSLAKTLNDSTLPSLVTATLLVTSGQFPESFSAEVRRLAQITLTELRLLLDLVLNRADDGKLQSDPSKEIKQSFTEATGRVWENCDAVIKLVTDDVPGFVVRKADQWLALMKDAVQELQEWDPEEDVDDIFGDAASDDEDDQSSFTDKKNDQDQATIAAGVKEQSLKVLSRIPQSVHVVIKQRLAKIPPTTTDQITVERKGILDIILKKMRLISECIDESAEALYMGNAELCLKKSGEARALTIEVVNIVLLPWQKTEDEKETKEDTFVKRALTWIQQVDTV